MKKIVQAVLIVFLLLSVVEVAFVARPARGSAEDLTTLEMTTLEDVSVSENGSLTISILINVSCGPLADMYRKMLGAPNTVGTEEELPIPEEATQEVDAGGNVADVSLPVGEGLYESIAKEQLLSFGLRTEIVNSEMVPRGSANECRIMISATGSFEIFNATNNGSSQMWEAGLGPFNTTGIAGIVLTRLMFAQMMLEYVPGAYVYRNYWHVRVKLPENAVLLNQGSSHNWAIDFGGGTYLNASASLQDPASIVIDENVVITESNVTATPEYLANALSTYKTFQIKYSLPSISTVPANITQDLLNTNWSHKNDTGWITFPDVSLPLSYADEEGNSLDMKLTISPKLKVGDYIGWQFFTDWNFPFLHVDKFWAMLNVSASIGVRLEADASLVIYQDSWNLLYVSVIKAADFYGVPVIIYIDFTIDANLLIEGHMSFVAEAVINGEIDAGVTWDHTKTNNGRYGWDKVFANLASANVTDFAWQLAVGISIRPGINLRVEFLFYGVAGPFAEFDLYLEIEETLILPNATILWEMSLNLDIYAGVTINGWLRNILGLSDWNWVELSLNLWSYSGSWNIQPQPPPHKPSHDLQIIGLNVSPMVIVANNSAFINLTVRNTGDYNETSEITVSENDSMIDLPRQFNLTSGESFTFSFNWNSATLEPGSYILKGSVTPVIGENNTADNEMNMTALIVTNNDIAVVDANLEPNDTYVERTVNITVTITNLGDLVEDSNVTVNANNTAIGTLSISQLEVNQNISLVFSWNTNSLAPGNYIVWTNVSTLHYDINIANNNFTSKENSVRLRTIGDVNGDGKVDIYDAITASRAFGSKPRDPKWDSFADLKRDDTIDIFDLIMIGLNFGKTENE